MADACVAEAQTRSDRHRIGLRAPSSLRAQLDAPRLEQVLTNLLDNAVKYSPQGGDVDVALSEAADGTIEIAVRDFGSGIVPERRERIFERFYRAHEHDYAGGMGLGLYISKQIVELHGGTLRAEFPEDGGTRFVVDLPRVDAAPPV
jgi:signal transduction histidine kinase